MGFAQNLKYLMSKFELSNYRLAKDLNRSQTTVANWLENKTDPHPSAQKHLAERFNISVDELMGDDLPPIRKNEQKNNPAIAGEEDEATTELRNIWESADQDERAALLEMARLIKKRRAK